MDKAIYLSTFDSDVPKLAAAARLGLELPVSGCPGWTVADLVVHIGEVQRSWTYILQTRAEQPPQSIPGMFDSVPGLLEFYERHEQGTLNPKDAPVGLIEWYLEGARALGDTFRGVDMDDEVAWHWSGDRHGSTHLRNQAVELAVHRWDAQSAHGVEEPIETELAEDAIDQYFEVQLPNRRRRGTPIEGTGETYHFHQTDGHGEWFVRFDGDDVEWSKEHRKGDVAVRGTASDLLLFLFGRVPADRLDVIGDRAALDRYQELVPAS